MLVTDHSLAVRLERAEAFNCNAFVQARARLEPASGATSHDFNGTLATFDGAQSPLTQTFGIGLTAPPTNESMAEIERFFENRGAPVFHETCPLADTALLSLLPDRSYRPVDQTTVLYRELSIATLPKANALATRVIGAGEESMWADTAALGWSDFPELGEFMRNFGLITANAKGTRAFVVEQEGVPIATGALAIHDRVALLAGASTRPEHRARGAQAALLSARLRYALELGCDLAMMAAQPGSGSQRNAERQGFRIAYTRTKWMKSIVG